jgi:hypothetical protein
MIELNVNQTMLRKGALINFPAFEAEAFPIHQETIIIIVGDKAFNCNVDRVNFGSMCNLYVKQNQGFEEWINENHSINDTISFQRVFDATGIVRVLIVNN